MNVTYENNWEYMDIHVDLPVPYEENYQLRMLNHNNIAGLLKVKGSGRDGQSRYTYRTNGGITMKKAFEGKEMRKEDVIRFTESLIEAVDDVREHLLNPDSLLLSPELIFLERGKFRFCYLPVSTGEMRQSLCSSFHTMTEYFVKNLDYQDTAGIFFVYKMHKETLKENYELKKIIEECRTEEKEWKAAQRTKRREEQQKRRKEQHVSREKRMIDTQSSLPENAVFSIDTEDEEEEKIYHRQSDTEMVREDTGKYGTFKKAVNRIKTGRWGNWEDLITEMDGHGAKGHL